MSSRRRDLVLLILQFLAEENFEHTLHILERESRVFLSLNYVEDAAIRGEWDELESYLNAFIQYNDDDYTRLVFLDIRMQKYFEALHKDDHTKAVDILRKELTVFSHSHPIIFRNLMLLLCIEGFRDLQPVISTYARTESDRYIFAKNLKEKIIQCPGLRDKFIFPISDRSRLYKLIEQSLCWQHHNCNNSIPMTPIKTLMVDHTCTDQSPLKATDAPRLFSAEFERRKKRLDYSSSQKC